MQLDHPLIRASRSCPVCGGEKDSGIACWPCFRLLKHYPVQLEAILDREEQALAEKAPHVTSTWRKAGDLSDDEWLRVSEMRREY